MFLEVRCNAFIIEFVFMCIEFLVEMCKLSIYACYDVSTDSFVNNEFVLIQVIKPRSGDESVTICFLLDFQHNDFVFKGLEGSREVTA